MKHSLDVLGTWGCPWHGLIKDSQLTLPNAATMPMRQPNGLAFERGSTHLIALPTAPVTERTTDQQEADDLAGRQWLNKALIAGDQIHGKPIGLGKWIYHDADGKNWLVSTTLQGSGPALALCTVTLRRFGVFGGAPETHEYTVAVPGLEEARAYWGLASINVQARLYSAHPQGSGAIFAVMGFFNNVLEWRPIAWQQLTLSGPAGDCTVGLNVLYDADASTGSETAGDSGSFGSELVRYELKSTSEVVDTTVENFPSCSGTYTSTQTFSFGPSGTGSGFLAFPSTGYTQRKAAEGNIVGVVYGADGSLKTITLDAECDWTVDATDVTTESTRDRVYIYDVISLGGACVREEQESTPGRLVVSQTVTSKAVAKLAIKVNGVTAASETITYQTVRTGRLTFVLGDLPDSDVTSSQTYSYDWTTTRSTGHSATATGAGVALGNEVLGSHWSGLTVAYESPRQPFVVSQNLSGAAAEIEGYFLRGIRSANGLYGLQAQTLGLNSAYPWHYEFLSSVATPGGALALPALSYNRTSAASDYLFLYGSYNPITGAAARALSSPVCWT
mgnify:CR=1 FL=1